MQSQLGEDNIMNSKQIVRIARKSQSHLIPTYIYQVILLQFIKWGLLAGFVPR